MDAGCIVALDLMADNLMPKQREIHPRGCTPAFLASKLAAASYTEPLQSDSCSKPEHVANFGEYTLNKPCCSLALESCKPKAGWLARSNPAFEE